MRSHAEAAMDDLANDRQQSDSPEERNLVYGNSPDGNGLVFLHKSTALELVATHRALSSSTWGELRAKAGSAEAARCNLCGSICQEEPQGFTTVALRHALCLSTFAALHLVHVRSLPMPGCRG